MDLIRIQPSVSAEVLCVAVQHNPIHAGGDSEAIIGIGTVGMDVEDKNTSGPFKSDDLVLGVFI